MIMKEFQKWRFAKMNTNYDPEVVKIRKALNSLKPGEKLEIDPETGEMRKVWITYDKRRKSAKVGNYFNMEEVALPLKSKIPHSRTGQQSFFEFGKLPVESANSWKDAELISLAFELEIDKNPDLLKQENYRETHYTTYRVIRAKSCEGWINKEGKLVMLVDNSGREFRLPPEIHFIENRFVSRCEKCGKYFREVKLYKFPDFTTKRTCKECAEENQGIEIIIT